MDPGANDQGNGLNNRIQHFVGRRAVQWDGLILRKEKQTVLLSPRGWGIEDFRDVIQNVNKLPE